MVGFGHLVFFQGRKVFSGVFHLGLLFFASFVVGGVWGFYLFVWGSYLFTEFGVGFLLFGCVFLSTDQELKVVEKCYREDVSRKTGER